MFSKKKALEYKNRDQFNIILKNNLSIIKLHFVSILKYKHCIYIPKDENDKKLCEMFLK